MILKKTVGIIVFHYILLIHFIGASFSFEEKSYVNGIPCGGYAADCVGRGQECEELRAFFEKWTPKAERCDPEAQELLGLKYSRSSVTWHEAVKWFKKAAEQGYAPAQFELGVRYEYGEGVLQDFVFAHMWYNISASKGYGKARSFLSELTQKMTPVSIAKAQDMARDWKPTPCKSDSKK
ncbi:MAG: sel1 repeat family protein [Deltaproteobacteria bacterium]|nr:sel1 repeat family protein [Deltaproteobacteria bacterium]MBW1938757.1 sel1 repeat family protein [Deltaproteobacteria bacterium]